MSEGRKTQIKLLEWDDRKLDILVQPKLLVKELLDLVASQFNLKEKEFFGLAFLMDSGHYSWLELDKRVLEHDFPSKVGLLTLYFAVRFYVDSIGQLRDTAAIEAFYLNARHAIFKGQLECDSETAFELAAHVLQVSHGDYTSDSKTRSDLKKLPVIPTSVLKEHPSLEFCEERIIHHYQKLPGTSRGSAIVNYMGIVESLETYGIHFYAVKDKKDIPWWLGISLKGIAVYDKTDRKVPRKFFSWKQLENLFYRDTIKKFSIEVHDPKRIVHTLSSFNLYEDAIREPLEEFDDLSDAISDPSTQVSVSRRTFGPGNVAVHTWYAATPQLTKAIWCNAVKQHQFYLDRKHSRSSLVSGRSMSEIAAELSQSNASLSSSATSDMSRSESSHSIPSLSTSRFGVNLDQSEVTREAQKEMFAALKQRKAALEETMKKKLEELKQLCLKEGELTGHLPPEYPATPGENPPLIRRRIGTAFSLNTRTLSQNNSDTSNELSQLELEYDLQCKINKAAHILAKDKSVSKAARKQRLVSYQKSSQKVKDMEKKLNELRRLAGRGALKSPSQSRINISSDNQSEGSLGPTDSTSDLQSIASSISSISAGESPSTNRATWGQDQTSAVHIEDLSSSEPQNLSRLGTSQPDMRNSHSTDVLPVPVQGSSSPNPSGYVTSQVYSTQTQYRSQRFPTLSGRSRSDYESLGSQGSPHPPRYGGSQSGPISPVTSVSTNNLYNVNTRRTSQYDSMDELTPTNYSSYKDSPVFAGNSVHDSGSSSNKLSVQVNHGSMESGLRQQNDNHLSPPGLSSAVYMYGSLDRRERKDNSVDRGYPLEFCPTELPDDDGDITRGYPQSYCPTDSPNYGRPTSPGLAFQYPTPRNSSSGSNLNNSAREPTKPVSRTNSDSYKSPVYPSSPARSRRLHITVTEPTSGYRSEHSPQSDLQQQYSPRFYEGGTNYGDRLSAGPDQRPFGRSESPQPLHSRIVTMNKMKPHTEVSKPYEISDFYKYSERLRRQRLVEQYKQLLIGSENISLASNSSHHSSDSEHSYHSGNTRHSGHSEHTVGHSGDQSPYLSSPNSPYTRSASPSPYAHPLSGRANYVRTKPGTPTTPHVQVACSGVSSSCGFKGSPVAQIASAQTLRQSHYQPPKAMSCRPVLAEGYRNSGSSKPLGSPHPR